VWELSPDLATRRPRFRRRQPTRRRPR
jgi:hypothetical protein